MNEAARPTPTPPRGQSDDTIRLTTTQPRPSVQKKGDRTPVWIGIGVALGVIIGGAGLYLWPSSPPPPAPVVVAPPAPTIPKIQIERANAQKILLRTVQDFTIYRLLENPGVLVLDFASLAHQGRMLDRIAAHVEKAATPRDRLLNDAELAQSVKSIGETPHGYYYGHDYSAESLLYFFDRARRDRTVLKDEEVFLRSLLEQEGWLVPGYKGGLISLPVVGADGGGGNAPDPKAAKDVGPAAGKRP